MSDSSEWFGGATGMQRRGNLVRRRTGPWTPAVHALIAHARANGVPEAPEVVGMDAQGCELLVYIEGDHPARIDDDMIVQMGALARRLYDALASFTPPTGAVWRRPFDGPAIVHGDISATNVVVRDGLVVGLIDWDFACPGRPLEDLAYVAWMWAPLAPPSEVPPTFGANASEPGEQARRLRLLADAFGADERQRGALLSEVATVQAKIAYSLAHGAATGDLGMPALWREGRRLGSIGRCMAWLDQHWDEFDAALRA